jgi:4-amino-4-deoxy-L-arabinose transferase-like glycosyltransferase
MLSSGLRWRGGWLLCLLLIVSFAAKTAFRVLINHDSDYWHSGYSFYFQMADNYLRTGSFYIGDSDSPLHGFYAVRPPLYPLLIATVCNLTDYSATAFVFVEALISTITVALIYGVTLRLAPPPAAFLAAGLYAFYPYSFCHDTQLQDTVLNNTVSLAAVACIVCALDRQKGYLFFVAGLLAGAAILTRPPQSVAALFLLGLILWLLRHEWKRAFRFAGAFGLGTLLLVGPWLIRNKLVVDHFTLTSETGNCLACGNNPYTFEYYPYRGSIDESWATFHENMPEDKRRGLARVEDDEFAADAWYRREALDYIQEHPWETIGHGFYKIAVNFLGILSPSQGTVKNTVYTMSYWILTLLALVGLPYVRRTSFFKVFVVLVLAHMAVSFVFWAHTSHRSWLDPLFAIPAGIGMAALVRRCVERFSGSVAVP